jgi:hypothetical protein
LQTWNRSETSTMALRRLGSRNVCLDELHAALHAALAAGA